MTCGSDFRLKKLYLFLHIFLTFSLENSRLGTSPPMMKSVWSHLKAGNILLITSEACTYTVLHTFINLVWFNVRSNFFSLMLFAISPLIVIYIYLKNYQRLVCNCLTQKPQKNSYTWRRRVCHQNPTCQLLKKF